VLFLPISHNWLLSDTAQHVYLACAILTLALLATLAGTHAALGASGAEMLNSHARSIVRFLLLPEITGTALLWAAMWYFWFGFDQSHYVKKALFFVLLFLVVPLGTLLYYFICYRRLVRQVVATDSGRSESKVAV
jgi:hypothetical protein